MAAPERCMIPEPRFATDKRYAHLLKGSKLEATSKVEGFIGSWFKATVIDPPERPNSKFRSKRMTVVEFSDLLDEDGSLLLRETVDCAMLRPVPPKTEEDGGFEVGDIVDSFEKDGWWTGKVDRFVEEEGEEVRYVVSFAEPKHEITFEKDRLRLHLDWVNGKWFRFWNGKPQELAVKENGCVTLAIDGIRNNPKEHVILNPVPTICVPEGCSEMMPSMNEPSTPLLGNSSPPLPSSCHRDTIDCELPTKNLKRTCVEEHFVHADSKPAESNNSLRDYQNKECDYHIASTSHGKYNKNVRSKRRKTRAGRYNNIPDTSVTDDAPKVEDVQKDLFLEEQLAEAVQSESALAKQDKAPKADAINDPHMEDLTFVSVRTKLNPKEQAVESLEIFRKFPQQPHFLPLKDAKECFREGLAIAKMVTFASTAKAAIDLSIDDNANDFTDCLEALETLEAYGFDTKTLQSRLVKLISLKQTQRKIEEEMNELKGQVSELKHEIVGVDKEISECLNKVKFYEDKLRSELVKKEKKGLDMLALETSLDLLNTEICRARLEFEDSKDTW